MPVQIMNSDNTGNRQSHGRPRRLILWLARVFYPHERYYARRKGEKATAGRKLTRGYFDNAGTNSHSGTPVILRNRRA